MYNLTELTYVRSNCFVRVMVELNYDKPFQF